MNTGINKLYSGSQKVNSLYVLLIMILLTLSNTVTTAWAVDYYLSSSSGSDNFSGLYPDTPWKSLYKLNHTNFSPGDRIFLKKGDIWREGPGIIISNSGSASNFIEYGAYGSGPQPVINGSVVLSGWTISTGGQFVLNYTGTCEGLLQDGLPLPRASTPTLLDGNWYFDGARIYYKPTTGSASDHLVEGCKLTVVQILSQNHITLKDITFYGGAGMGIGVVNSGNIQIINCTITANAWAGIGIKNDPTKTGSPSSNILIQGNTISWNGNGIYLISESGAAGLEKINIIDNIVEFNDFNEVWKHKTLDGHGLGVQNTSNSYFGRNEFRYNNTGPIIWTSNDRRSDNNVIARNYSHHNQKFGMAQTGEGQDNSSGNKWAYNIITDNGSKDGLDGGFRINRSNRGKNFFVHNTLARNDVNIYLYSLTDYAVISKNISFSPQLFHVLLEVPLSKNVFTENLYFPDGIGLFGLQLQRNLNFAGWQAKTGVEKGSSVGNPLFADASLSRPEHYTPASTSPVWIRLVAPSSARAKVGPFSATSLIPELPTEYNVDYFGRALGNSPFIGAIQGPQQ